MSTQSPTLEQEAPGSAARHPLEPLSPEEIVRAVAILRAERSLADTVRFSSVELQEPPKAAMLAWPQTGSPERRAFAIVLDRADGAVHEAVISLDTETVLEWHHVPGVQPRIMAEEFVQCEEMLKRHPEYLAALAKRGITDLTC